MNMTKNKPEEIINDASQTMSEWADAAKDYAAHALGSASDAKDRATASMRRAAAATTDYVSEQPVRSVCIAAGIGAAVALLAYGMCGKRSRC
jgi:ElaB/YqjD/DUF883 family membrane-anchored ribosome-binding protein